MIFFIMTGRMRSLIMIIQILGYSLISFILPIMSIPVKSALKTCDS